MKNSERLKKIKEQYFKNKIDVANPSVESFSIELRLLDAVYSNLDIENFLSQIFLNLAEKLKNNKVFIGHIKAYISFNNKKGGSLALSLVHESVEKKEFNFQSNQTSETVTINFSAIVYNNNSSKSLNDDFILALNEFLPENSFFLTTI